MSNRNFDNRVIIQRLQQQTYARNLYQTNMNGQTLISNPQNSDSTSSRLTTFVSGAQTDYFRGLLGAGETISLGGIFGISPFVPPTVPSSPIITEITDGNQQLTVSFLAPISYGKSFIIGYQYSVDNGISFMSAGSVVSPIIITGLTNGITYQVVIRAVNSNGFGDNSNMVEGTPATIPTAPTITGITDGNQQLTVTFTAPTSNGGATITDYQYQISQTGSSPPTPSFISIGPTVSPFTITGLTNGTSYDVVIKAINRMGDGPTSDPVTGTPATIPTAPTITGITDGNQQLTITFMAPTSNGGATITDYQYQISQTGSSPPTPSFISIGPTVSPFTITGLTNGTSYDVVIKAINRMGDGPTSDPVTGTPATIPTAPTITGITDGNQQLTVTFTAPTSNGGATITDYQYQISQTGSSPPTPSFIPIGPTVSPFTITGLTNGTSYDVVIKAINRMGSTNSDPVTAIPATIPTAPTITGITDGNQQLTVTFTAPLSNGGSVITNYKYSTDDGTTFTALVPVDTVSTITIPNIIATPLTNGTRYPVRIRAVNRMGDGDISDMVEGTPATVPSAPTITVTGQNQSLSVAFDPTPNGGATITGYQYLVNNSSYTCAGFVGSNESPIIITGLTNGTSYSVFIIAVNRIGNGPPSTTQQGTPVSVPSAPTIIVITPSNQTLSVAFTAPTSDGGSPITNYQYSLNSGSFIALNPVDTTSPITISGLVNGTSYSVIIRAVTLIGNGASSVPVTATPVSVPSAPTNIVITAGNQSLSVAFTAPTSDGGSPITNYQYSINSGSFTALNPVRTISPITIPNISDTPLTNGTSYSVIIRAVNLIGNGASSSPASGVPQGPPSAPTITGITEQNGQLAVSFSPPATDNGAFILDYQYAVNGGSFVSAGTTTSPITITGLTNGTSYSIQIKAANFIGAGTGSNIETAKPQPTGPNVFQTRIQGQADTYTLICTKFTSFTPTTASVLYTPYGQLTPQSIDNSGTTTIMVMPNWSGQNLVDANIFITFSDGIRTSMNSNTFNFFDILVFN